MCSYADEFLSLDGIFCMRLLAQNTTDVVAAEIVSALYKRWKAMHLKVSASSDSTASLTGKAEETA